MFRNYIKIAWRSLARHKLISFVNLFGLTMGLACCLLIAAYIYRELSFDRYHKNASEIYRLTRQFNTSEGVKSLELSSVSPPFGYYFPAEFPEVEAMTRLLPIGNTPMMAGENKFNENNIFAADPQLFHLFDVSLQSGNPETALSDPFSILLSKESAQRYFGNENPLEKTIRFNSLFDLKITGVFESFPGNSHLQPEMLISFSTLRDSSVYGEEALRTNWGNNAFLTYLKFPPGYDVSKVEARFPAFVDKYLTPVYQSAVPASKLTSLKLQPLTSIHLYSHLDDEGGMNGDITRVYIFAAIALFILIIACINYMNLATARSSLRAREIGIRKVVGARKKSLVLQFLGESVLTCFISLFLALGLAFAAIPVINQATQQSLSLTFLFTPVAIAVLLAVPLVLGLLAGIYPALFLSSFNPTRTLKGLLSAAGARYSLRQLLVVLQFSIGIVLIIVTVMVFRQLDFLRSKSLGYDKEQVITLNLSTEVQDRYDAFRTEMLAKSVVKDMARSTRIPTGRLLDNSGAFVRSGDSLVPVTVDIRQVTVDFDFAATYGLEMQNGRFFSRQYGSDSASFVINEAAVRAIGWPMDDAVGRPFQYGNQQGQIIGVVKDFHFESLHQSISPMVFLYPGEVPNSYRNLSIKMPAGQLPANLASLEDAWKQYFPATPFDYSFVDERYARLYEAENIQAKLFSFFSVVAIIIACLGLFGLSAFSISQRVREIGVRKVLGASVGNIVVLVSTGFLKLVLVAALLAFPLAWLAMSKWLENFAYRVGLAWWVFIAAALLAAIVAAVTISFLAVKAALSNPVKNLRTE